MESYTTDVLSRIADSHTARLANLEEEIQKVRMEGRNLTDEDTGAAELRADLEALATRVMLLEARTTELIEARAAAEDTAAAATQAAKRAEAKWEEAAWEIKELKRANMRHSASLEEIWRELAQHTR